MRLITLARRSLTHYRRDHVATTCMVMICGAIISGALLIGFSVRQSLHDSALSRLGPYRFMISSEEYTMTSRLASALSSALQTPVSGLFAAQGLARRADGTAQANHVGIYGIDSEFATAANIDSPSDDQVFISDTLAQQLKLDVGDWVILRLPSPSSLPSDSALYSRDSRTVAMRVKVADILPATGLGRFSLRNNHLPPMNLFVNKERLTKVLEQQERINLLLIQDSHELTTKQVNRTLKTQWQLADSQLRYEQGSPLTVTSARVLIPSADSQALLEAYPEASPVLTWFVNNISTVGEKEVPYSMVAALPAFPNATTPIKHGQIILNQWAATALDATIGSTVRLYYFTTGQTHTLTEMSETFTVSSILNMDTFENAGPLSPDIPGMTDSEHCRDWDKDFPINFEEIGDSDEAYWETYGSLPKAVISYEDGRRIWSSSHGATTAIRLPASFSPEKETLRGLEPGLHGIHTVDRIAQTQKSISSGVDFTGLFIGFSWFIITSTLILTAQFIRLAIERRSQQMALITGLGFTAKRTMGLHFLEFSILIVPAAAVGAIGGMIYANLILYALQSSWTGAIGSTQLSYHHSSSMMATGALLTISLCLFTAYLTLRQLRTGLSARDLTRRKEDTLNLPTFRNRFIHHIVTVQSLGLGIVLMVLPSDSSTMTSGLYFGAGCCFLLFSLLMTRYTLRHLQQHPERISASRSGLALRNLARNPGRSVSVISVVATGAFMVLAIGANRHEAKPDDFSRSGGTGGFEYYAETSVPLHFDLNNASRRIDLGLDTNLHFTATAFSLRDGDDASCLNLTSAQTPRILGANRERLAELSSFTFSHLMSEYDGAYGWDVFGYDAQEDFVLFVADEATATWGLKLKVGDSLTVTNDHGAAVEFKLAAVLAESVLQGYLIIDQAQFTKHFPEHSGSRVFLIDQIELEPRTLLPISTHLRILDNTNAAQIHSVIAQLTRSLEDVGFSATPTPERLSRFKEVENTYLSIFGILGGMGVLLGIAGMAAITIRTVAERQSEWGILRALGYNKGTLNSMMMMESGFLLSAGLLFGILPGLVSMWPGIRAPWIHPPWLCLTAGCVAILAAGLLFCQAGVRIGLSRNLQESLRYE